MAQVRVRSQKDVEDDVERLREWLRLQPHLPYNLRNDFDENILLAFVNGTKSLEIAKRKLDNWFTYPTTYPPTNMFTNMDPKCPAFKERCKAWRLYSSTGISAKGYRVGWLSVGSNPDQFDQGHSNILLRTIQNLDWRMHPNAQGYLFALDCKNIPLSNIARTSVRLSTNGVLWQQNVVPRKVVNVIVFNAMSTIEVFFNTLCRPLIKEKLHDRIIITSEDESILKKYIPIEMIPKDYGGRDESIEKLNDKFYELLLENREWIKKYSDWNVDECKRPPDSILNYGMEGTFRNLCLD